MGYWGKEASGDDQSICRQIKEGMCMTNHYSTGKESSRGIEESTKKEKKRVIIQGSRAVHQYWAGQGDRKWEE